MKQFLSFSHVAKLLGLGLKEPQAFVEVETRNDSPPELVEAGVIELEVSEVDRRTAGQYGDVTGCIIYTALRNRGYNATFVGVEGAWLESMEDRWLFEKKMDETQIAMDVSAEAAPFYKPSIVGKKIRLIKQNED